MLSFDTNIFPYKRGVYIVGGSIRDLLCDRPPVDYDVVVQGDLVGVATRGIPANTLGALWVRYTDVEDSAAKMLVKQPVAAYVEQVYGRPREFLVSLSYEF